MRNFAANTTVSVEKSRAEIEACLQRYGATAFAYAWSNQQAMISFVAKDRQIRFILPLPARSERRFQFSPGGRKRLSVDGQYKAWEQACRQRWRALLLAIKAKLESVSCGIATFEDEFLAYVVDPASNKTIGEIVRPEIADRYAGNVGRQLLLPGPVNGDRK